MTLACSVARADITFDVDANTRWRDFGDLYVLSQRHDVDGTELGSALASVASQREIEPRPLAVVLTGYAELAQPRY